MTDPMRYASPESQCSGKEAFSSPQIAQKVLRRWSRSKRRQGKDLTRPVTSYRCHYCGFYHLGGTGR